MLFLLKIFIFGYLILKHIFRCYSFKKHEHIVAFFNNFDEFLCEEAMWQISESIKPRGSKKTT